MTRLIVRSSATSPLVFSTIQVGDVELTSTSNGFKVANVEWSADGDLRVQSLQSQTALIGAVYQEQLTITDLVVTDSDWTPIPDINVLESNVTDVYFELQGTHFRPSSVVFVGTTLVESTYVSPTILHVKAPSLPDGQYDVKVVRPDGETSTRSVMYSVKPTWSGVSDFGVVYGGFSFQLSANSDSNIVYTPTTTIPPDSTLYANGVYVGNNQVSTPSVYAFTVAAIDEENQQTTRDFAITYGAAVITGATYTDASWTPLTQTALDSNTSDVYWTINGSGLSRVTSVSVDGTAATSLTAVSDSVLRVEGPQKARGSYDVTLSTPTATKTFANVVFYSDVPVFTTAANLGNVYRSTSFDIPLQATSDSAIVSYANTTTLPTGVTLNGTTGNLTGFITQTSGQLYSFGVVATDQELQSTLRTFSLTYIGYQYLGQISSPQVIGGEVFSASSVLVSSFAASKAFDGNYGSFWHDEASTTYINGVYQNARYTNVSGTNRYGEWLQIQFAQGVFVKRFTISPRSGWPHRMPTQFALVGSNDGSTWSQLFYFNNVNQTYADSTDTNFDVNAIYTTYTHFRLIFMRLVTNTDSVSVQISQWKIFDS